MELFLNYLPYLLGIVFAYQLFDLAFSKKLDKTIF